MSSNNDIDGTLVAHLKTLVEQILILQSSSNHNQEVIEKLFKVEGEHEEQDKKIGAHIQSLG